MARWVRRLQAMPLAERAAVLAALSEPASRPEPHPAATSDPASEARLAAADDASSSKQISWLDPY